MVLECLDDGTEIWIPKPSHLLIPIIHLLQCLFGCCHCVENESEFHRKLISIFQNGIVLEKYVDAMKLRVSPFVSGHHQGMFAAREYLAHGLTVIKAFVILSRFIYICRVI